MTLATTAVSRRSFLVGSASAIGGLSLGFHIPFAGAAAKSAPPEVNAWVVIKPDDTVLQTGGKSPRDVAVACAAIVAATPPVTRQAG